MLESFLIDFVFIVFVAGLSFLWERQLREEKESAVAQESVALDSSAESVENAA